MEPEINDIKKIKGVKSLKKNHFIDQTFCLSQFGLNVNCHVYVTNYHKNKKRKRSYINISGIIDNQQIKFDSKAKLIRYLKENKVKVNGLDYYFHIEEHIEKQRKRILGKTQQIRNQFAQTPESIFEYFKSKNLKISDFDPAPINPRFNTLSENCVWKAAQDTFIYLNPPFNKILDFLKKIKIELQKKNFFKIIILVPIRTQNSWFKEVLNLSYKMEINNGVKFKSYDRFFPMGCLLAYIDVSHPFYLNNQSEMHYINRTFE